MNNDFFYQKINSEEMQILRENLVEDYVNESYEGFSLFTPSNSSYKSYEHYFFVATHKESQKVAAVLKLSRSAYDNDVWSITWVDVHQHFRRIGLARSLYSFLNQHVTSDMIVVGTLPTNDGKNAKLQELRIKILTNCQSYGLYEDYYKIKQEKAII